MFPTMTFSSFYTLFIIMVAFVILSGKEKIIYPFHNHGLHHDTEKKSELWRILQTFRFRSEFYCLIRMLYLFFYKKFFLSSIFFYYSYYSETIYNIRSNRKIIFRRNPNHFERSLRKVGTEERLFSRIGYKF